jgi:hypothetical protein
MVGILGFFSETAKCHCLYNPIIPGFLPITVKCHCLCNLIIPGVLSETTKCQEAGNDGFVEKMTFNSFRQEAWNDRLE